MIFRHSFRSLSGTVVILGIASGLEFWCLIAQEPEQKEPTAAPPVYPVQRYESLWKNSIFGRPTAPTASNAPSEWNLAGVFEIDGTKGAVLINEKTGAVENVTLDTPNDSGIKLVTVQEGGKGAPPRVQIVQNGKTEWVISRKIENTPAPAANPNRALVNSQDRKPAPRRDDTQSESQASAAAERNQPENLAPPSPLDVPSIDVPLPVDPSDPTSGR